MKKIIFILILIIASYLLYAENLTDEQLFQIVKNFENNQNLYNLSVIYDEEFNEYEVCLVDNNNDKSWIINNNIVSKYLNHKLLSIITLDDNQIVLSENTCINIAFNYLNLKNISLSGYDISNYEVEDNYTMYTIYFFRLIPYNITPINRISIDVDKTTGEIAGFLIINEQEPIISSPPTLTVQEAKNSTMLYTSCSESDILSVSGFFISEDYIVRTVKLSNNCFCEVDAYNGNVVDFIAPKGIINTKFNTKSLKKGKKLKFKKSNAINFVNRNFSIIEINLVLCDTESPNDVKYTDISTGFEIDKEDKGIARMEVNGKKFIFRNGSYWCFINNKTYNMGGNCIIKEGKLELPEEFYKKVQTKDYDFFQRAKNN